VTRRWDVERDVFLSVLSPQARLVLLTLLALSNAQTCVVPAEFSPSLSRLALMTGLSLATIKRVLNELEEGGWVIRKRPDVVKARAEGERTRYRLARPKGGLRQSLGGLPESLGLGSDRATGLGSDRATSQTAFQTKEQQQQKSAPKTTPESVVSDATGATLAEAAAIAKRVQNERSPRSLVGLLRRMAEDGDLTQFLIEQRAATIRADVAAAIAELRRGPECRHGVAGGEALHPQARTPLCPQCRAQARRPAA
jgi:hypothetical protein